MVKTVSNISQTSMSPSLFPISLWHMQSCTTVMILNMTSSSPEESLASNLQCDTVLLNSVNAASRSTEFAFMRPQTKKLCKAASAVDVMGPVDNEDRTIAKKGASRVFKGSCAISRSAADAHNRGSTCLLSKSTCHVPSTSRIFCFSSWKPAMRSASLSPLP